MALVKEALPRLYPINLVYLGPHERVPQRNSFSEASTA